MNIIKFGGSIVNPDGKYDEKVIGEFIKLVKNSKDKFIFVVGGGKLCRKIQWVAKKFLKEALKDEKQVEYANDWLGIATTKINAHYVLKKFEEKFGDEVILTKLKKYYLNAYLLFIVITKRTNFMNNYILI